MQPPGDEATDRAGVPSPTAAVPSPNADAAGWTPGSKLRTVIADDQVIARQVLRRLLSTETDIDLVAECSTGPETLETIRRLRPDLVFLDVQMPHLTGFEVLRALGESAIPAVVFVTANQAFATEAAAIGAEFVMKPCLRERVQAALRNARTRLHRPEPPPAPAAEI